MILQPFKTNNLNKSNESVTSSLSSSPSLTSSMRKYERESDMAFNSRTNPFEPISCTIQNKTINNPQTMTIPFEKRFSIVMNSNVPRHENIHKTMDDKMKTPQKQVFTDTTNKHSMTTKFGQTL